MKILLKLILLTIFYSLISAAYGQSSLNETNYKKYWWYKQRLNNDYLVVGDCQGCSLPMAQRAANAESDSLARWGDNTINLGNYIAVLATEYELLQRAGQPTDSTVKDLYYAIKAVNRLDNNAESVFRCLTCPITPQTGDLNGFFIRDDVPHNFLDQHKNLKQGVTTNRGVSHIQSDYQDYIDHGGVGLLAMSHDQVWALFMGFSLVSKFVDNNVSYQGKPLNDVDPSAIYIKEEGKAIADRIISRIKNNGWYIKNPVDGSTPLGGYIGELSYGAAEAACFIKNENVFPNAVYPIHSCNDYHNAASYLDSYIWNDFGRGIGSLIAISDEDFKVQLLAAMGNSWWTSVNPFFPSPITILQTIFNPANLLHPWNLITTIVTFLPIPPVNLTSAELSTRVLIRDYQHLTLLRQVLHGGTNLVPTYMYNNLLNSAPCEGPWCYSYPSNSAPFEWSTSNRLHKADERGGANTAYQNYGEFNGLDYMLYYNLFALSQGTTGVSYFDYVNRRITVPFPFGVWGLAPNRAVIEGFSYIDANNIINNNAAVDYRAGKEIHLGPGFHAITGCDFHAYIDPFECSGGDYRMAETGNDSTNDNMATAVAYAGQTTFVNYPNQRSNIENSTPEKISTAEYEANELPLSLTENSFSEKSKVRIQPNPSNGSFQVVFSAVKVNAELTLMNIVGNNILQQHLSNPSTTIDISGQSKGIYYLKVQSEQNVEMLRIIYQ